MKKILIMCLIVLSAFMLTGCNSDKNELNNEKKDAIKFKEEYESLNNTTNANGVEFRSVSIDEDNPYVYLSPEEVLEKINNKETFYIYVGDKQCPWCRSVIEKSIELAKEYKIDSIYYINIWDDDHNEILRDKYELNEDGEPSLVINGTDTYKELLNIFDSILPDYTLKNSEGEKIPVGEKRIFAPSYIYIEKGNPIKLVEGISSNQTDYKMELTEEILKDEENIFREFFEK